MSNNTDEYLYGLEIVEIPRSYTESPRKNENIAQNQHVESLTKYNRFISSLLHTKTPFGIRFQVNDGNPRLYYLTPHTEQNIPILESTFIAHFPEFRIKRIEVQIPSTSASDISIAIIRGIPRPVIGSLNTLARVMLESRCDSIYQTWAFPRKPSWPRRILTKYRLESALRKSQQQESIKSWLTGTSTKTRYDVQMTTRAKKLEAEYKRLTSKLLLECSTVLAFYNGPESVLALENALGVLFGSISQPDKGLYLRHRVHTGNKGLKILRDALSFYRVRYSTQLLPDESIPYLEIPKTEIGIRQGYSSSFSTAAQSSPIGTSNFKPEHVAFGCLYSNHTLDSRRVMYMPLEYLRRHFAIIGTTGSGKSSTKNRIVIDAWRNGISSLLIEPVKTDARIIMGAIDETRLFTVGLEQVAPIRLNPMHVDKGVHVNLHINLLVASFLAAWPVYGVLANYLRRVIAQTYVNKGWDVVHNVRGPEITLEDLWYEGDRFAKGLKYGSQFRMDFRGAILGRIEDLCDPARAAIFNATESISIEELLSVPTIIELKHLGDQDLKAFFLSFLLVRLYEYFDKLGPSDRLRNLLFIDEAHAILEEIPKAADTNDVASVRRKTADQIVDMIAESRSLGLGIGIMDQNAMRLSRDALKTCHTKIIHTNTSEEDRNLLASETGCNREQAKQIDVLRIGEAIIRGPEETVPVNVQIFYDLDTYPQMSRSWTNDDVRERMRKFYEAHPEFARTPEAPTLPDADAVEEAISYAVQIEDTVTGSGFREQYLEMTEDPTAQDQHLAEEIIAYYASHIASGTPSAFEVASLLAERSSELYGIVPYKLDWVLVRQLIGNHADSLSDGNRRM